jgi:hypothetical protein
MENKKFILPTKFKIDKEVEELIFMLNFIYD